MRLLAQRVTLIVALVFCLIFAIESDLQAATKSELELVRYVLKHYYVDILSEQQLMYSTPEEIVENLGDPYTNYYSSEEMNEFLAEMNGDSFGFGIFYEVNKDGSVKVLEVIKGSPAEQAGICKGDIITALADKSFIGKSDAERDEIFDSFSEGSIVNTVILRNDSVINVSIKVGYYHIPLVSSKDMGNGIVLVSIFSFGQDTYDEFTKELAKYPLLKGIILDLRYNTGGMLGQGYFICDDILQEDILMWIKKRDRPLEAVKFHNTSAFYSQPMVLLVNEYTASTSEVIVAAVKDYRRGVILGKTTYGKFCGQLMFRVGEGSILKYTVDYNLTPNKHELNKIGITPDIVVNENELDLAQILLEEVIREQGNYKHVLSVDLIYGNAVFDVKQLYPGRTFIKDNRLFISLQEIANITEHKIEMDDQGYWVVEKDGIYSRLDANSTDLDVVDTKPYISVTKLAEVLGGKVEFNQETKRVVIYWN